MAYVAGQLSKMLSRRLGIMEQSNVFVDSEKRRMLGFGENDFVIDVEQGKYGISFGNNFLYTDGLSSCCGVVVIQGNNSILFHLDDFSDVEKVVKITEYYGLTKDSTVLICPGPDCHSHGQFKYAELEEKYRELGLDIKYHIFKLNGYIKVSGDVVEVGSIGCAELVKTYQFGTKKVFF